MNKEHKEIISCILLFIIILGGVLICMPIKTQTETFDLAILNDKFSTTGDFFLFAGSINGELVYVYYTITDGIYEGHTITQDDLWYGGKIQIIEDTNRPHAIVTKLVSPVFGNCFTKTKNIIFHIPNGTISYGFEINGE